MIPIYIDSKVLVGRIVGAYHEKRECKEILRIIRKKYDTIWIPQTVLGESLTKIMEKSKDLEDDLRNFTELLTALIDIKNNAPPLSREILSTALEIQDPYEYNIGYCDAVLVSYGLCHAGDCDVFIIDSDVHHSAKIHQRISECPHKVNLRDSIE